MKKAKQYFQLLLKTYKLFFKSAPALSIIVFVIAPIQALLTMLSIWASQRVIDSLAAKQNFWLDIELWIVATILVQILPSVATSMQGMLTDKLTGFLNLELMKKSKKLNSLSIFDDADYFDVVTLLQEDASWRPVNLIVFGISVLQSLLTVVFALGYLARFNWLIAVALIAVMIPQSLLYYRIQQEAFETMVERSKNSRFLHYYSGLLLDRVDAKEVLLFNMFDSIINKYMKLFNSTHKTVNKVRQKQLAISSLFLAIAAAVTGLGFIWFSTNVAKGNLPIGVLVVYISIIGYISTSMARLVEDSSLLYDSLLWIEKYFKFMDYQDHFLLGNNSFPKDFQVLEVKNVSFTYPFSDVEVLHDVNFEVKRGEKIAVVGMNGSGKTTLVKLLMRYYDPTSGKIQYDHSDSTKIALQEYRDNISATFQDFSKFKLTLAENVTAGKPVDRTKVKESLLKAGLSEATIDQIGLDTILSKDFKNGIDLSGGQWQKIALARDIYSQGNIEFLDEPTAALDPVSEAEIYKNFIEHNKAKTIFFITHRLSAVKYADKVLLLSNGTVSGFDTHEELLKSNSEYQKMYQLQKEAYL